MAKRVKPSTDVLIVVPSDGSARAKLIPRPATYLDAINLIQKHFQICCGNVVVLETDELKICGGEMLEITEDVWGVVKDDLAKLYFDERPAKKRDDKKNEVKSNAS
ncbi:hypothetical protein AAF712_007280 [Marasmius tenuissimus]|uniref:Uncharacterized protein n=1 Tax=Marasmius tenuissimus TaxID=585030 RepID=A0ABR2ZVT2_9AGAR